MSKKISVGTAIVLILFSMLMTFQVSFILLSNKYRSELNNIQLNSQTFAKLEAVDEIYRTLYIGEIDDDELMDTLLRAYVYGTGDKYAYYLNAEEYSAMMEDNNAEMQGVGITVIYENGIFEVISVMPDSPALEAGVEPGDYIVYVDDDPVSELGYTTALNRLRGKAGTTANFTVLRGNDYIDFSIRRGYVNEQTVSYHIYEADPTIGIVKILSFDLGTPDQFKNACQSLINSGVNKFIFDVRYNPGGDLTAIVSILDYLLPEGPIVHIADASGKVLQTYSSDASMLDYPMCVLCNGNTASAAELFSSALQDYKKATLIGENTYGKGCMQTILPLGDGSGLGITYRLYNPPYSANYEGVGVKPDIEVAMDESLVGKNIYKITDTEDTQLQKAVEVLKNN